MRRQMIYPTSKRLNEPNTIKDTKWVCIGIFQWRTTTSFNISVRIGTYEWKKPNRRYWSERSNSRWDQESGLETMQPEPMLEIMLQNWAGKDTTSTIVQLSHCNECLQCHQHWSRRQFAIDSLHFCMSCKQEHCLALFQIIFQGY